MHYALFKYRYSQNLGDEIQSLAARRFLPAVMRYVERDNFAEVKLDRPTKLIANGWYSHRPETFGDADPFLEPLFVAFHISPPYREAFKNPKAINYLRRFAPIGCRDRSTVEFLSALGVEAYFSGCLTLTLEKREAPRHGKIVLADAGAGAEKLVPEELRHKAVVVTHHYDAVLKLLRKLENRLGLCAMGYRLKRAERLLRLYSGASLVVTERLHVALPCLAMGTPVYYIVADRADSRFPGLIDLVRHSTRDEFVEIARTLDWLSPPANPERHLALRARLIRTCDGFIADDARALVTDGNGMAVSQPR